jgi:hypothetical protein
MVLIKLFFEIALSVQVNNMFRLESFNNVLEYPASRAGLACFRVLKNFRIGSVVESRKTFKVIFPRKSESLNNGMWSHYHALWLICVGSSLLF